MKRYVKDSTIFDIWHIRRENPNISIPDDADCSEMGYEFLVETPIPTQEGFYAIEVAPVGNTQVWELVKIETITPSSITMRQCRLKLISMGLDDDVEMAIEAITDPTQKKIVRTEWEYAATVERHNGWIEMLGGSLGLTSEQLDTMFIEASTL